MVFSQGLYTVNGKSTAEHQIKTSLRSKNSLELLLIRIYKSWTHLPLRSSLLSLFPCSFPSTFLQSSTPYLPFLPPCLALPLLHISFKIISMSLYVCLSLMLRENSLRLLFVLPCTPLRGLLLPLYSSLSWHLTFSSVLSLAVTCIFSLFPFCHSTAAQLSFIFLLSPPQAFLFVLPFLKPWSHSYVFLILNGYILLIPHLFYINTRGRGRRVQSEEKAGEKGDKGLRY